MVETQLNETNARAGVTPGVFKAEQYGMNEQGEPFMEIREELPDDDQLGNEPAATAPNSVEAARKLQSTNKSKAEELADQALLEKLKALELEEEGELSSDEEQDVAELDEDELLSGDEYDTEIAENMFDHFDDDEEYGMDGVVDGEDFSYHEMDEQDADDAQDGDDAQDVLETMDTIVTPSVQHEMHYSATQPSTITEEPSPLESVVKERISSDTPQAPDSPKNKGKTKVAPIIKPRVSRFKKSVQEQQQSQEAEPKVPRKKVSWGPDIVHEAEEPQAANIPSEPVYNIRSPADIYHQLLDQRLAEQANEDEWSQNVTTDMQSLIKDASTMKETIYMPSERDIPQVTAAPKKKVSRFKQQRDQDKSGDQPVASTAAVPPPTRLDTSVMRGAVVEKETEDVDMDEVDEDMLEKEVSVCPLPCTISVCPLPCTMSLFPHIAMPAANTLCSDCRRVST